MIEIGNRKRKDSPFLDLGNILKEYGERGDKTRTIRQLNIQAINYKKKDLDKSARIFRMVKREINKRR